MRLLAQHDRRRRLKERLRTYLENHQTTSQNAHRQGVSQRLAPLYILKLLQRESMESGHNCRKGSQSLGFAELSCLKGSAAI